MTSAIGIYGGYKPESGEARALGSFSADKFSYQDQQKNIIQLNNAVGYMSGYMRKMQKGIDDASQNFIQQIQGFISEIFILFAGGGDTGLDFGDLKYIFQAIGALFGFGDGILPINLFGAAWHFFSTYIIPVDNFHDLMDLIIDGAIASVLDLFGEVPILGQALQQLAVIISDIRDLLGPIIEALEEFFSAFDIDLGNISGIGDFFGPLKPIFDAFSEALDGISLPDFTPIFHAIAGWTQPVVDIIVAIINAASKFIKTITGQLTSTDLSNSLMAATAVMDPVGAPTGLSIPDIAVGIVQFLLNSASGFVSFLAGLIPGLDASKIITGFIGDGLLPIVSNLFNALTGFIPGFSVTSTDVGNAAAAQTDVIAAVSAAVATLQAQLTDLNPATILVEEDFEYSGAVDLAKWDIEYYDGFPGEGTAIVDGHQMVWDNLGAATRGVKMRYIGTDGESIDDDMVTKIVLGTSLTEAGLSTPAFEDIYFRMNAANTEWTRLRVGTGSLEIKCRVSGTETTLGTASLGTQPGVGAIVSIDATGRDFTVRINGSDYAFSDASSVSAIDSSHRWRGLGMYAGQKVVFFVTGQAPPGPIAHWASQNAA